MADIFTTIGEINNMDDMKYKTRRHDCKLHSGSGIPRRISTKTLLVVIIMGLTFLITGFYFPLNLLSDLDELQSPDSYPVLMPNNLKYILLWTPQDFAPFSFFKEGQKTFIEKKCLLNSCFVTANRNLFGEDVTKFHAVAFNGRNMYNSYDLPKTRSPHQKYVFFNMESSDNYPICDKEWDGFFNWTATYKLDSDISFPYIQIRDQSGELVGPKRNMKWLEYGDSQKHYGHTKTKAVAWFVSNCKSRSNRNQIAADLAKALKRYGWTVDIYGSCGDFTCPRSDEKYCDSILERDYFFYLSFENSFAEDYVTEKVLTALQNNVVPIVLGGANYTRFLPPDSYLDALKTSSDDLAATIDHLIRSPSEYNKFFRWKSLYRYRNPATTDSVCAVCAALHNDNFTKSTIYDHFRQWWNSNFEKRCAEWTILKNVQSIIS